ncbi:MAG: Ig-like domain-containing protein [Bryobacterales bacterium]
MGSRSVLASLAVFVSLSGAAFCQQPPAIHFNGDAAKPVFELRGWKDASPVTPPNASARDQWQLVFAVFVAQADAGSEVPPLSGAYDLRDATLFFVPRYPLQPGLSYRAVFSGAGGAPGGEGLVETFSIPRTDAGPQTFVEQVYPTANRLPENLLKLYIHFSAPMSRGEAYQRASLLDSTGTRIDFPFLELDQELWDPEGRRLTLLFDPGRVKRDLLPNREVGSPLREGERYVLVVDGGWLDASGRPLRAAFRKSFEVGPPDHETPSEKSWRIEPPKAGTQDPLAVRFPEPMDQALLVRVIDIKTPAGEKLAGSIGVDEQETRWQFRPEEPWKAGDYLIDTATLLEDLAGNSLARPFEVDVFEKVEERVERVSRTLRFTVAR